MEPLLRAEHAAAARAQAAAISARQRLVPVEMLGRLVNVAVARVRATSYVQGRLELQGIVGVQQGTYDTGAPCISVYYHLATDEARDAWTHTMVGDDSAWDTGLEIECRFLPLAEAS